MLNICLSMPLQSRDTLICPECVARVPVSLWGSGGWSCVRQTLRNRSQPFAWGPHGCAYGEFCKISHFWRFQTSRGLVSHGRRGTLWHSNMFHNVSKVVLCGRLPAQHSTSFTPHTFHSTLFRIPQSTMHWYGNRGKMYKTVQITCFTEVFHVTAFGFVGCILF